MPEPITTSLASGFDQNLHKATASTTISAASWAATPASVVGRNRSRGMSTKSDNK